MKNGKRKTKKKNPAVKEKPAVRTDAPLGAPGKSGLQAWHLVAGGALAMALLFALYQPALDAPFLFDDQYLPVQNPAYQDAPLDRWIFGVRPTLMLSYWINFQISTQETTSHHVFNLFFHFLAGVFVFLVARKILGFAEVKDGPRGWIAAFCGGVFLFHPLQTESVAYIASRSENLSVLFFYAALAAFLYRRSPAIRFPRAFLVLALFGLAVTTKEHTAMLPFLLLLTDYFWNPGFSFAGIKRNWRIYLPIAAAGGAGFAFIGYTLWRSDTAGFEVEGVPWYLYFATQCKVIWIYVRMFFLPFGQNVDHDYPVVESLADPLAIAGFAALVAAAAAAWIYRRRFPLAAYGFFTFLLLLAPTSSFVPIKDFLVERRLYLPIFGLLLVAAELLRRWKTSPRTLGAAVAAILILMAGLTANRAKVWAGPLPLWQDSVAKNPGNWRASFQLAYAYYAEQRCSEAAEHYARTAELHEADFRLLLDWGLALDCAGRPDEALAKFREAEKLEQNAHLYTQMAVIYGRQGKNEEAMELLEKAEALDKYFPLIFFYKGNVFSSMSRWEEAASAYRVALQLDRNLEPAQRGLARATQQMQQAQ